MADFQDILYDKHQRVRGAAWITINRPQAMNSFTGDTLTEMAQAMDDASSDPEIGVIVITGAGDRASCAGGDARGLQASNGYSIGGGNHLAYFCDFTIASENATFMQVGPRVGSPASGYIVANLTRVVGAKKAKEMWMTCRRYSAKEALEMGLVNTVVAPEELDAEVDRWCTELLQKSPSCLKILKASFRMVYEPMREASARHWVREIAPNFYKDGEADEGKNAFLERREPDFSRYPR